MKRMLVAGSIAALALLGSPGVAQAAPADASCFGGIHKAINTPTPWVSTNVGQLVKSVGGPAKNAAATELCGG